MAVQLDERPACLSTTPAAAPMRRAVTLVLVAIGCGLIGLYLVRAALLDVGGFRLGSTDALRHIPRLATDWRFLVGGLLIVMILLISLELYGHDELSKIIPLYSLSYVVIALVGQFFLDERVTTQRWLGIAAIVTGVAVVVRS